MLVSQADIQQYVARITASSGFSNSERLCELLRYTVMEALGGRSASLKESVLGVTVFGRRPGYDSDANSIVRVEFARLRKKLEQYYRGEGAHERWRILFPRGAMLPSLCGRNRQRRPPLQAALSCSRSLVQAATLMTNTSPMA
jgi:hypothetical protein